jgi:hypothetical protein
MGKKKKKKNAYELLVGKAEVKAPIERPRGGLMDNIKMDLGEIGRGGVDWIDLAQIRSHWRALVNTIMKYGTHEMLGSS